MSTSSADNSRGTQKLTAFAPEFEALIVSLFRKATRKDWLVRLITFVLPVTFLAVVVFQPWVEPMWMFLDPLTAAELSGDCCHTYYGFVSMLGVMLWVSVAAVAAFCAAHQIATGCGGPVLRFAITAALLNGWLALDDAFLLHETVMPSFGVPQNLVLGAYVSLAIAYIFANRVVLLAGDIWLLIIGGLALITSLAVDTLFHSLDPNLVLVEDSAKFFGMFFWVAFHASTLVTIVTAANSSKMAGEK